MVKGGGVGEHRRRYLVITPYPAGSTIQGETLTLTLTHPHPHPNPTLTLTLTLTPGFARRATELWRKAAPLQPDMLHLGLFRCLGIP